MQFFKEHCRYSAFVFVGEGGEPDERIEALKDLVDVIYKVYFEENGAEKRRGTSLWFMHDPEEQSELKGIIKMMKAYFSIKPEAEYVAKPPIDLAASLLQFVNKKSPPLAQEETSTGKGAFAKKAPFHMPRGLRVILMKL